MVSSRFNSTLANITQAAFSLRCVSSAIWAPCARWITADRATASMPAYNFRCRVKKDLRIESSWASGSRARQRRTPVAIRASSVLPPSFKMRSARPCAISKKAGSFKRVRACSGVLLRIRRVQEAKASGASNTLRAGWGVARQRGQKNGAQRRRHNQPTGYVGREVGLETFE